MPDKQMIFKELQKIMKLGIVGLPNVGKSTLFNAITNSRTAQAANYAFCTIEPNVGAVAVPDPRLDVLAEMYSPKKVTPAKIEFVDIAGLVKGASKGEGLGNKFLSHIREVDAIVHVVRCFGDSDVMHVENTLDPVRDIEIINAELMLADLETAERRTEKAKRDAKGDKRALADAELFERISGALEKEIPVRAMDFSEEERRTVLSSGFLTFKPVIYAANMDEDELRNPQENGFLHIVEAYASAEGSQVLPICAKTEEELAGMDREDKLMFLQDMGLSASGLDRLITASYSLLGLISFLTAGADEVRAWTIKNGTRAPKAAGKIHSDFERGFIRAEVVSFSDLTECGSMAAARDRGLVRSEGKDYIMKDGDVVLFRFNV